MEYMSSETDRQGNDPHEEDVATIDNIISQEFNKLDCNDDIGTSHHENEHHDDDVNDDEEDDDDFTFVFIGNDDGNSSPGAIYAFEDGKNFPLFDQKLLLDGTEYELEQVHDQNLPFQPPVNRVFTELPPRFGSSSKNMENDHHQEEEEEEEAAGPFCAWSKDQSTSGSSTSSHDHGLSKKSNSTGFSKLWRLREKVHRSNSDGRDAFVFLKGTSSTDQKTTSSSSSSSSSSSIKAVIRGDDHGSQGTFVKVVNGNGATRKGPKVVKKTAISAHEVYMRSRGGHTEEERRKSYLPYRPELMGFFTNVHGGLSKNVHPY